MKVYTDGSRDDGVFGVGYVIELKSGGTITGKNYVEGEYTSMDAEWYALMQGLDIASENITEYDDAVTVVTDCQPLVEKMRGQMDFYDDEKWYACRKDMYCYFERFEDWELEWQERGNENGNDTANRLAREALWQARDDESGNAVSGVSFETWYRGE